MTGSADEMIQEATEERAALDKVLHFLKGAAKAEVVIPLDAAEDRACIAEYPHRHWIIAEVLTRKPGRRLRSICASTATQSHSQARRPSTPSRPRLSAGPHLPGKRRRATCLSPSTAGGALTATTRCTTYSTVRQGVPAERHDSIKPLTNPTPVYLQNP